MKNIKIFGLTAALFAFALSGCEKVGKGKTLYTNYAYLAESSAVNGETIEKVMRFNDSGMQFDFNVSLVDFAEEEVTVTLDVSNQALLEEWADAGNANYNAIPQSQISFSGTGVTTGENNTIVVTIPENGDRAAVTIDVQKNQQEPLILNEEYAVRVKIASVVTGGTIMPAPKTWSSLTFPIVALAETADELDGNPVPIASGKYPLFKFGNNDHTYSLATDRSERDWLAKFNDMTLELWFWGNEFGANYQFLSNRINNFQKDRAGASTTTNYQITNSVGTMQDIDEFFVRLVKASPSNMEIKAFDGSGEQPGQYFRKGEWNHLAIVYKTRDNSLMVYRNGEQVAKVNGYPEPKNPVKQPMWAFVNMVGTDNTKHNDKQIGVREIRFWNTARRSSQIRKYMRTGVNTDAPGLVAYWPLEYNSNHSIPTEFPNVAAWAGSVDIPIAPKMIAFSTSSAAAAGGSIAGDPAWSGGDVDFATTAITDKTGSRITTW